MTAGALALVLCAAVLHAGWNALAKRAADPVIFLWSATACGTALLLPFGAWTLARTGFPAAAAPFVAGTIALHAFYFYALGRAYGSGAYSLVYPVARGLGVALVPVLALPLFGERLSPLGTAGVALVVTGIVALHSTPAALVLAAPGRRLQAGTGWAVVTGLTIATYSVLDKAGVGRLHPVPYMMLLEAGCLVLGLPLLRVRAEAVRREWRRWPWILAAGALSALSYMLVLVAFGLAKTGYVVAARELSIVLSAVIGSLWLREGRLGPRLVGAGVILAGVVCVALAR